MYYHYEILHKNYEVKLGETLRGTEIEKQFDTLEELMQNLENLPPEIKNDVRFFGGGLVNHNFFFTHLLKKDNLEKKISNELLEAINNEFGLSKGKELPLVVLVAGIVQGVLFCMDGFVSALLKSPFNQMCYAINKAEGISYERRDRIITKATESNEHCKETLKKFGILTISTEIIRIVVEGAKQAGDHEKLGNYWYLLNISYLIPLALATYRV
ncbi:6954_t:CDS:2 [Ambispora leptoticha]|uniref:6954_t:CDS:1 n=1 Tax=Ambispora leptoticha TaxID=144679 RepID=A0A9N8YJY9_9GLOM|nr:6954_t:CDS:2 [Ambispora leptoticha]